MHGATTGFVHVQFGRAPKFSLFPSPTLCKGSLSYLPTYRPAGLQMVPLQRTSITCLPTYLLLPSLALGKWCLSALVSAAHTLSLLSRHTWRTECGIWTSRARASHGPGREYLHGRVVCIGETAQAVTGRTRGPISHFMSLGARALAHRRRAGERAEGCGG